jgi:hypothetical protein
VNTVKELTKTNTSLDNLSLKFLDRDFRVVKEDLYKVCAFYAEPLNNPGYFKWQQGKDLVYRDYTTKDVIENKDVINFDCFQFVWFALQELAETGVIEPKINKFEPLYNTISKLLTAIEIGCMVELIDIDQLSTGVIFYLKTKNGWDKMGERHLGFYFTNGDVVEMISDRNSAKGVDIETFSRQAFFNKFTEMSGCYVSSNKICLFR